MNPVIRLALAAVLVAALVATYRKLQEEERTPAEAGKMSPRKALIERIRTLPAAPASWKLLESAPPELDLPGIDGIQSELESLLESAQNRVVFESYFLKQSLGRPGILLKNAASRGIRILGLLHPNPMSDAPFLDELRTAGAQIIERDLAPAGGNPEEGYVHAKFIVVDGRRGYLGSANLGAAAMLANREMGLSFDDAPIAQTLELMTGFDAGHVSSGRAEDIRTAVLLQGAADGFRMEGLPLCDEGVSALCDLAQSEIDIMMFAFSHQFGTYDVIANAVRAAVRRGVAVRLIHDASTLRELPGTVPTLRDLDQWGVDIRVADLSGARESSRGHYHAKSMRVDDEFLMVGSNNWTDAASHENRETAIILRSPRLAKLFKQRFVADWNASGVVRPFVPPAR